MLLFYIVRGKKIRCSNIQIGVFDDLTKLLIHLMVLCDAVVKGSFLPACEYCM